MPRVSPLLLAAVLVVGCGDKADAGGTAGDTAGAGGEGDGGAGDGGAGDGGTSDGGEPVDADGDGVPAGEDCDDADATAAPGLDERCDGIDNDCDGEVDEDAVDATTWYADQDGDTYGDPDSTQLACTAPPDHVADATDCDDGDATAHPGGTELCGGGDEDCDGTVDEADAVDAPTWYVDADGDGYGDLSLSEVACSAPAGTVADATDCDDGEALHHPGADETCDGDDDDCDGTVDEPDAVDAPTWYDDVDGDSYGDPDAGQPACAAPSGTVSDATDCDDSDATHHPGADETCDGDDDDCDGTVDEPDAVGAPTWYTDADSDGYGDPATAQPACAAPSGTVSDATDCDDSDATHHPGASETCDGDDDDCDGTVDEPDAVDASTWHSDVDGDGYGDLATAQPACSAPSGTVSDATDCDDSDASHNPGASETCDGDDDDCDGSIDESDAVDASTWYTDADVDGYGDLAYPQVACTAPSGTVVDATDCDDSDAGVNPGADERCWTSDDADCDGDLGLSDEDCSPDGADSASERDGVITGTSSSDRIGSQLASGADVNADGYEDLLVTAEAPGSGAAWLFLGGPSGLGASSLSPTAADQTWAGGTGSSSLGSGAALGDISGDGLADVIVGDSRHSTTSSEGAVFARFGALTVASSAGPASADLAVVHSEAAAYLGAVATGDLDGDGVQELVLGAPGADQVNGLATNVGAVYLFVGGTGLSGSLTEADADRALYGEHQGDGAGEVVAVVPDTDGDGLDELVVGALDRDWGEEDAGAAYLWSGAVSGTDTRLVEADAVVRGAVEDDQLGAALAGGDLDGDGYGDWIIGVPGDDATADGAGAVLVFYGPLGRGRRADASEAELVVLGEAKGDGAGGSVAAGDVDGDGLVDVLLGGPGHDQGGTSAGSWWMLRGTTSGTTGTTTVASADWEQAGATGEQLGSALALGDWDADGHDDVAGAATEAGGSREGAVYLVHGGGRVQTPTVPTVVDSADDADGDGWTEDAGDCDDTRAAVYPGAAESCGDSRDEDCDGQAEACAWGATESLADAYATVHGDRSNRTGIQATGIGDINGDGHDDLAIGDSGDDTVHVWFGPLSEGPRRTGAPDLSIEGAAGMGEVVAALGDFDGDGIDDVAFGAPDSSDTSTGGGAVYVLLGSTSLGGTLSFPADADLDFTPEAAGDGLGAALAGGVDLDGDGATELIMGADAGTGRGTGEGVAYLVSGGRAAGTWGADTAETVFGGETRSDELGGSVDFAGDIDGDGEQDLLLGAPDLLESRGGAYLVFGPVSAGFVDLGTVRARFVGDQYTASCVRGIGDVNGDGYDDLAVGRPGFTGSSASPTGTVHVWFGPVAPAHQLVTDADLTIEGTGSGDMFGVAIARAGDVDGDGLADLLVGARYSDDFSSDAGGAWLFHGPLSSGTLDTTDADVNFEGWYSAQAGADVGFAGDLDGDGHGDVVVGAPNGRYSTWSWVNYSYAGFAMVFRGGERGVASTTPTVLSLTDDADGDGYTEADGDCDDTRASVSPAGVEVCENDRDDDCDGADAWCLPAGATTIGSEPSTKTSPSYDNGSATTLTDLDLDGYDDLVVGLRGGRTGVFGGGELYVRWGPMPRGQLDMNLIAPDRTVYGSSSYGYLGTDLWPVGDLDLDGVDDLLIGAPGAGTGGAAYLLLGATSLGASQDITTVATTTLLGTSSGDAFGTRVSGGDLDGDGLPDLVVVAAGDDSGATDAGAAYVFLGPVTAASLSAASAHAVVAADTASASLDAMEVVRDVDGDGLDDLLLGAAFHEGSAASYGTGEAWLFTAGPLSGTTTVASADATFEADASGDRAGADVASAGDVDGDGLADLLIGAAFADGGSTRSGIAHFFYGGSLSGTIALATADTRFLGTTGTGYAGDGLGTAGDVDADGYDDVLIGVPRDDQLHLFRAPLPSGDVLLSSSDAALWPWGDGTSGQVGEPGDQDGDGFDDLVVAAPDSLGRVWVVPGGLD